MTREEEIQKLIDEEMGIDNYGSCDFQVGVCYGVRPADRTMIEKFLYWLTMKSPFIDNKDMDKAIVGLRKYLEE